MIKKERQQSSVLFLQHDSVFESHGGVQYYLDDFLNLLSHIYGPHHLHVLLAQRTDEFALKPRPYCIETVRLSQGLVKKFENRFSPKLFLKALRTLQQIKPSVIIVSHLSLAPLAAILSKLTHTPFLVLAYGIEVWGNFQPQDKWALKQADGIISISHWTKDILEKQGFESKKISVVHPSVTGEMVNTAISMGETQKNDSTTTPIKLLTVSRLNANEQYKGHDHVLEALRLIVEKKVPLSIQYTIQGNGDDLNRLQGLVDKYHLNDTVSFVPQVKTRDELKTIYQSHDIFIMPSRFGCWDNRWRGEGFGIVYVEAALFGVPSIAYRCGGVTDIIEDQKNGVLVEQDNIEALAEAIIKIAQDRKQLKALGAQAKEMAIKNFSPERIKLEMKQALKSYPFWVLTPN